MAIYVSPITIGEAGFETNDEVECRVDVNSTYKVKVIDLIVTPRQTGPGPPPWEKITFEPHNVSIGTLEPGQTKSITFKAISKNAISGYNTITFNLSYSMKATVLRHRKVFLRED